MKAAREGFSLIEVLITLVIIIILLGVGFYLFGEAKGTGRDAKRKQDLTIIANALELYYQAQNPKIYPGTPGTWYCSYAASPCSTTANPWIAGLVPDFINALPQDPIQSSTYRYVYISVPKTSGNPNIPSCPALSDGQYFILGAYLESRSDKDSIGVKVVKDCKGNTVKNYPPFTSSNNWYVLTTP